jgi:NAD(P)-dependent dehydrogenase (short-subunit alcohol dehydrogenase family)
MAKSALLAMTRNLAAEWGPKGIRTVAIAPGAFPTPGAVEQLRPDGHDEGPAAKKSAGTHRRTPCARQSRQLLDFRSARLHQRRDGGAGLQSRFARLRCRRSAAMDRRAVGKTACCPVKKLTHRRHNKRARRPPREIRQAAITALPIWGFPNYCRNDVAMGWRAIFGSQS